MFFRSEIIDAFIKRRNITLDTFCRRAKIDRYFLDQLYENKIGRVNYHVLYDIAKYLKVTPLCLLDVVHETEFNKTVYAEYDLESMSYRNFVPLLYNDGSYTFE